MGCNWSTAILWSRKGYKWWKVHQSYIWNQPHWCCNNRYIKHTFFCNSIINCKEKFYRLNYSFFGPLKFKIWFHFSSLNLRIFILIPIKKWSFHQGPRGREDFILLALTNKTKRPFWIWSQTWLIKMKILKLKISKWKQSKIA